MGYLITGFGIEISRVQFYLMQAEDYCRARIAEGRYVPIATEAKSIWNIACCTSLLIGLGYDKARGGADPSELRVPAAKVCLEIMKEEAKGLLPATTASIAGVWAWNYCC